MNKIIPHEALNEREFELINIIGAKLGSNQRDLSRLTDFSLGQTNLLIRRLATKGYIRIRQLNKRKVEYLLTPKGFAEKMRKSIKYTLKTVHSIGVIREKIKKAVLDLYKQGEKRFLVLGKSDFAFLVKMVFEELGIQDVVINRVDDIDEVLEKKSDVLLICKENVDFDDNGFNKTINLIAELVKEDALTSSHSD